MLRVDRHAQPPVPGEHHPEVCDPSRATGILEMAPTGRRPWCRCTRELSVRGGVLSAAQGDPRMPRFLLLVFPAFSGSHRGVGDARHLESRRPRAAPRHSQQWLGLSVAAPGQFQGDLERSR